MSNYVNAADEEDGFAVLIGIGFLGYIICCIPLGVCMYAERALGIPQKHMFLIGGFLEWFWAYRDLSFFFAPGSVIVMFIAAFWPAFMAGAIALVIKGLTARW